MERNTVINLCVLLETHVVIPSFLFFFFSFSSKKKKKFPLSDFLLEKIATRGGKQPKKKKKEMKNDLLTY